MALDPTIKVTELEIHFYIEIDFYDENNICLWILLGSIIP